ncbi:MAG: hypothetical protein QXK00_03490 [archaeon]
MFYFKKQDFAVFLFVFLVSFLLNFQEKIILLSSALLLISPFLILERYRIPYLKKYPRISILFSLFCIFLGLWLLIKIR